MAPIRKGDGTTLAPTDYQQIRKGDGTVLFAGFPSGKTVSRYRTDDFTTNVWPDAVGSSDIDTVSGLSFDDTAFGGAGGVSADGVDDYGLSDSMGSFGSNLTTPHAIAFRFSTEDQGGVLISSDNGNGDPNFLIIGTSGFEGADDTKLSYLVRDTDGNRNVVQTNQDVTDGGDYRVIIQRESSGGDASDIQIYIGAADNSEQDIVQNEAYADPNNFSTDVGYFARNRDGQAPDFNINATMGQVVWFGESLNANERENVFNAL